MRQRFYSNAALFAFLAIVILVPAAHADCYGVYSKDGWKDKCGEIPNPPSKFAAPTADNALNQNDKSYLCSLVMLTDAQCLDVQFTTNSSGLSGVNGVIKYGVDVRMDYHGKQCAGAVWKKYQSDHSWSLSSPTSLFGFPYACEIPYK